MAEVKIGVGANVGGVDAAIQKITASMNKLGSAVAQNQKMKFEPTDVKLMARDLALVNKQFQQTLALSAQLRSALKATGQTGSHLSQIDFSKLSADPRVAQRLRDRAFLHSVRGTALDPTAYNETDANGNIVPPAAPGGGGGGAGGSGGGAGGPGGAGGGGGGRRPRGGGGGGSGGSSEGEEGGSWWRRRPRDMGTATALAVGNGIGGSMGNVLTAGIAGGPMGAILAGVTSVIGKGMEWAGQGMDQAKARNLDLDSLKRSMGDLGVSFRGLSDESYKAAQGLGMANGEFVKLEQQANSASGGAYSTPGELSRATRSGVDLSRAYGLDPSQGVGFVSGMQRINSRQNNKELATQLAEAIVNAQGKATPGEVMQAMQGFAASQNRFNSGSVDLDRFGNAYGSMLRGDGMTADHASSILGQANSAMQQMGGTEASKNFTLQAFGNLDPIRAAMRAEGGLFGNGLDSPAITSYMSQHGVKDWDSQGKGPAGTNFGVMRDAFDRAYAGRGQYGAEMELDAEKNYFGLRSYADTSSFMNMSDSDHNGIATVLKNAGLKLGDVREGGLQAIASISKATSFGGLDSLYKNSIRSRGDMSPADLNTLDKAEKGGDFQEFQNELVRVLAGKGQEDDQATTQRSIDATLSDIKTKIGDGLLPMTNTMMQGIIKMAGLGSPDAAVSGSGAPYGFGSGPVPVAGGKGIVVQPGGSTAAPGGSTVGGPGDARMPRRQAAGNPQYYESGQDTVAGWANGTYGSMVGGAYSVNQNVVDGMGQLMGMGVDKAHASAIMASAIRESSMDPAAGHVGSYGLFQFDKARAGDFQNVMGKSLYGSSQRDQIDYMMKSMQKGGEEAGPGAAFWASNGKDAARVFSDKIERPKETSKEGDIRSGIAGALNDSNIHITLNQTVTTPSGQKRTQKLSTKVPTPSASGFGTIIELPPGK
jgi:hypothetical protein